MSTGGSTKTLAFRVTKEQLQVVELLLSESAGFADRGEMLRHIIGVYAKAQGFQWPTYIPTRNEDRAALKIRGRKS